MKKQVCATTLFLIFLGISMVYPGVFNPDKLKVYITMDKRFFYSDEDVNLKIYVKNVSETKNFFEIYDSSEKDSSEYTTFQPVVYDMKGREAEIIVPYRLEDRDIKNLVRGLDKRILELGPGESIVHSINLNKLYNLQLNTEYRVMSFFYPDFVENRVIRSDNDFTFRIVQEKIYNKKSEIEAVARSVEPKEIIMLALTAELKRDWENYVKYINIEKYINAYPEFVRSYYRADFEEKTAVEKEFIRFLTRERDDYILGFKILEEEFENDDKIAYVEVVIDRFGIKRTNRYKYRYTLEKYKNLWLITDSEATVMKGIKR